MNVSNASRGCAFGSYRLRVKSSLSTVNGASVAPKIQPPFSDYLGNNDAEKTRHRSPDLLPPR